MSKEHWSTPTRSVRLVKENKAVAFLAHCSLKNFLNEQCARKATALTGKMRVSLKKFFFYFGRFLVNFSLFYSIIF